MAHVGTTMDLRQGQAATGSSRTAGFWLAIVTAAAALAIVFAIVASQMAGTSAGPLAGDNSYTQVEELRGGAKLPAADTSYKHLEDLRGKAFGGKTVEIAPAGPQLQQVNHAPGRGPLR